MSKGMERKVGSHVAKVDIGGARVPIGFLASFRKKKHSLCESGKGFVVFVIGESKQNRVCECATKRAIVKLRTLGVKGFEILSEQWLADEMERIKASEDLARHEGELASPSALCPYPENSDQALAWHEGHDRKKKEASS